MIDKKRIRELAQERIDELACGLFIVEISISSRMSIQVELDKEEGYVSITECVSVSRNVEHNLDREEQDFELHVSSAGLDKPFRVIQQYTKNIGREVNVLKQDGVMLSGILKMADNKRVVVETTRKEKIEGKKKKEVIVEDIELPMAQIKETKIVISFK